MPNSNLVQVNKRFQTLLKSLSPSQIIAMLSFSINNSVSIRALMGAMLALLGFKNQSQEILKTLKPYYRI